MKPLTQILFFLILTLLLGTSCRSETPRPEVTLFDALASEDYTALQLTADWSQVTAENQEDTKFSATIQWEDAQGKLQQLPIQLQQRGKTRLQHCTFPPLKLIFPKDSLHTKEWGGAHKLKMVTHCNGDESLVLREYLAYQMYQQLTEKSFRVQLVKITYIASSGEEPAETHWGFILENHHDLAKRLDASLLSEKTTQLKAIDGEQYRRLALFQYMIGNTDWNMNLRHNIKIILPADRPCPVPVPYDFDYSGLVNAPYANPHPMMPVKEVRDRFFQWRGKDVAAFETTIQHFLEHKSELLSICQNFEHLSVAERRDMTDYLKAFYQKIEGLDRNFNDLVGVLNAHVNLS